jgi:hypothetical protein
MFETTQATDKTEDNLFHFGCIYRFLGTRYSAWHSGRYSTKIIFYELEFGDSGKPILVRYEIYMPVTMKDAVFWDIKTQLVPHRRHITSPLKSPAS